MRFGPVVLLVAALAGCAAPAAPPSDPNGTAVVAPPLAVRVATPANAIESYEMAGLLWLPASGNASTLLVGLHGSAGFKENNWGPMPVPGYALAEREAGLGRAFLAVDLPGYGDSPANEETMTFLGVAQAIASLARALRAGEYESEGEAPAFERVIAVGHSMGSILAIAAEGEAGAGFDGLVVTGWGSSGFAGGYFPCVARLSAGLACEREIFFHPPTMDPVVWDEMNRTLGGSPGALVEQAVAYGERPAGAASAQDRALANVRAPVLILIGGEDWIFADPSSDPERYASEDVEMSVVPDTGHFLFHHTTKDAPMAALDAWLSARGR